MKSLKQQLCYKDNLVASNFFTKDNFESFAEVPGKHRVVSPTAVMTSVPFNMSPGKRVSRKGGPTSVSSFIFISESIFFDFKPCFSLRNAKTL